MTPAEVAQRVFRASEAWFRAHVPDDFPRPVDGLYATEAVETWHRQRHGLADGPATPKDATKKLMGRLHGTRARAVSGSPSA
jgi:hypothetical protein